MKVLFAPDYREGIPYQEYLARELHLLGTEVEFLTNYRRGMPLARGIKPTAADVLHIHWPEVYFTRRTKLDWFRKLRYPLDLALASRRRKLFLTAHNLLPHNRHDEWAVSSLVQTTAQRADGVFVHSENAKSQMIDRFGVPSEKCWIIPYGDHTDGWDPPLDRAIARKELGLDPDEKICLVFGTVSPYKGSDEIVRYWVDQKPDAKLIVIGPVLVEKFGQQLRELAKDNSNVELRISDQWLSDEDLHRWLSAVDASLFNYREIFTSGAAALARSMGVPLLIPSRLKAADLHEPHPLVHRFESLESDLGPLLAKALHQGRDYSLAADWRRDTSWAEVARITQQAYNA